MEIPTHHRGERVREGIGRVDERREDERAVTLEADGREVFLPVLLDIAKQRVTEREAKDERPDLLRLARGVAPTEGDVPRVCLCQTFIEGRPHGHIQRLETDMLVDADPVFHTCPKKVNPISPFAALDIVSSPVSPQASNHHYSNLGCS